jgi:hypothetical protein
MQEKKSYNLSIVTQNSISCMDNWKDSLQENLLLQWGDLLLPDGRSIAL